MWTEHKTVNVGRVRLWHPSLRSLYFTLAFVLFFGMSAPGNPQPLPCPLQHTVLPPPPHFLKPVPSPKTHSQVLLRVRVLTSLGWEAVCWESEPRGAWAQSKEVQLRNCKLRVPKAEAFCGFAECLGPESEDAGQHPCGETGQGS